MALGYIAAMNTIRKDGNKGKIFVYSPETNDIEFANDLHRSHSEFILKLMRATPHEAVLDTDSYVRGYYVATTSTLYYYPRTSATGTKVAVPKAILGKIAALLRIKPTKTEELFEREDPCQNKPSLKCRVLGLLKLLEARLGEAE